MKKWCALLLLGSMLLSLTACPASTGPNGPSGGEEVEWTDSLDSITETGASWRTSDGGWDFGGEEFAISYSSLYTYEIYGAKDGDWIEGKVWQRNAAIQDRFNVQITNDQEVQIKGAADQESHYTAVSRALTQNSAEFDMVAMYAYLCGKLITANDGNFCDWRSEIPYCQDSIKAKHEWWPESINTDCTIMGRQYVAVSDLCITSMEMCYAVIFNQELVNQYNIASQIKSSQNGAAYSTLFDVVRGGDWTVDNMTAITKDFYQKSELNQTDGKTQQDVYGLLADVGTGLDAFAFGFNIHYINNDGVSAPTLWEVNSRVENAVNKAQNLINTDGCYIMPSGATYEDKCKLFAEKHALFALLGLEDLKYTVIKDMESTAKDPYGVLPYPKLDTTQTKYMTGTKDHYTVLAVPAAFLDESDAYQHMIGAVTEALSAYNCDYVKDQYYEVIITHQNVYDADSREMIDLIMDGRIYDITTYHYNELILENKTNSTLGLFFRYMILNKDTKAATYWKQYGTLVEQEFDDLIEDYNSIVK